MAKQKRSAENELTHDNWQDEEEPEEVGVFKKASEDEIKKRVIRTAKRRVGSDGNKTSAFAGFGGFGSMKSTPSSTTPFSFLSKITSTSTTISPADGTNGSALDKTDSSVKLDDTKIDTSQVDSKDDKSPEYYAKIKSLNESVSKWIKTHVDEDPLCILTPVFNDYEAHLKKIETEEADKDKDKDKGKTFSFGAPKKDDKVAVPATNCTAILGNFKFGGDSTLGATGIGSTVSKGFSFGSTADASAVKSSFSFGSGTAITSTQKADTAGNLGSPEKPSFGSTAPASGMFSSGSGFSFGATPQFSFGNVAPPKAADKPDDSEKAEDEEPPKNEFVPVVEDNSIYSKRCKVFVKQGGDYSDRGIGTLYLKKVEDSEKIQLIVRAETSLGNILLNLVLSEGLPASRMGKNNVMLVCIPTPDAKPPPTSVLLRVKTGEEADALLDEIKKHI